MKPHPPLHPHTICTRSLYRGRKRGAAQGMASMLQQKKRITTVHALSIGKTQGKEVCYRERYG